jgi:hypothetical protein
LRVANDLNPEALRRPQSKNKVCTDREFVETALGDSARNFTSIVSSAAERLSMSRRTVARYLARLTEAGVVKQSGGLYWAGASEP